MQTQCALLVAAQCHQRVEHGITHRRHLQPITLGLKVREVKSAMVGSLQTRQKTITHKKTNGDKT